MKVIFSVKTEVPQGMQQSFLSKPSWAYASVTQVMEIFRTIVSVEFVYSLQIQSGCFPDRSVYAGAFISFLVISFGDLVEFFFHMHSKCETINLQIIEQK